MTWSHIHSSNGSSRGPLVDLVRPYPDAIRAALNNMNPTTFWAYGLWRTPEGADLLDDIPLSDDYFQAAGVPEALTVEMRVTDDEGVSHHYSVGKPGDTPTEPPTEEIWWDSGRYGTRVHPHEVFTADEAADVFYAYFLTDTVAEPYTLRELDL